LRGIYPAFLFYAEILDALYQAFGYTLIPNKPKKKKISYHESTKILNHEKDNNFS